MSADSPSEARGRNASASGAADQPGPIVTEIPVGELADKVSWGTPVPGADPTQVIRTEKFVFVLREAIGPQAYYELPKLDQVCGALSIAPCKYRECKFRINGILVGTSSDSLFDFGNMRGQAKMLCEHTTQTTFAINLSKVDHATLEYIDGEDMPFAQILKLQPTDPDTGRPGTQIEIYKNPIIIPTELHTIAIVFETSGRTSKGVVLLDGQKVSTINGGYTALHTKGLGRKQISVAMEIGHVTKATIYREERYLIPIEGHPTFELLSVG